MLGGVPQIFWGTNFESVIQFGYPLDSIVAGRKPRAGSEYVQSASGVEDAWITGYDYELTASFRWIPDVTTTNPPATAWSGSTGVQAFLDYARAKNTFRFVPDGTNPLFYVDGCYISDPMDTHGSLESDGTRNLQLTIRNPTVDFHAALRGIMFEYAPGADLTQPVAATFARSGAVGPFVGVNGLAANALANVLRDRSYSGTPGLGSPGWGTRIALLEPAGTNLVDNSDYEADSVGSGQYGGATIVRDNAHAFSGAWALKVTTVLNTFSGCAVTTRSGAKLAATAGSQYASSTWVYATGTAIGQAMRVQVDWYNGAAYLSTTAGAAVVLAAGWNRLFVAGTAPATTTAAIVDIITNTAAQPSFVVWVDVPQFEAGAFATSAVPTTTVTVTRNADSFTWSQPYNPQAMFWLVDFIEGGTTLLADLTRLLDQGAAGANSRWGIQKTTGQPRYEAFLLDAAGATKVSTLASGPAVGDRVQLLLTIDGTGVVQIHQALNLGSDVAATASAAGTLPTAWISALLGVNSLSDGTVPGSTKIISIKGGVLTSGGVTRNTIALALSA